MGCKPLKMTIYLAMYLRLITPFITTTNTLSNSEAEQLVDQTIHLASSRLQNGGRGGGEGVLQHIAIGNRMVELQMCKQGFFYSENKIKK